MKAEDQIARRVNRETGVITLDQCHRDMFRLIGTNLPVSAKPGDFVSTLTVQIKKDENGLLAVQCIRDSGNLFYRQYLLPVSWSDELGPWVDLQHPWESLPGRLISAVEEFLEIEIQGIRYSTNPRTAGTQVRYVPDANLLCRYAVGEVGCKEVQDAASDFVAEQNAREALPRVQAELWQALKDTERLNGRLETANKLLDAYRQKILLWYRRYHWMRNIALDTFVRGLTRRARVESIEVHGVADQDPIAPSMVHKLLHVETE